MFTILSKRLTYAALIAGLVLPAPALIASQPSRAASGPPGAAAAPTAPAPAVADASDQETIAKFKETLAAYGNFVTLAGFGEVWVPTVTPEGWHPYPPCQWVYAKDIGWYYNDDTPWGAIVHHYGRWSHDAKIGWFWVPDADWSPGWVVWRSSDKWIGWAPMPPDTVAQKVSLDDFNRDKMWTFMDAQKFGNGCGNTVVAGDVYAETEPVSLFELPVGHIVDVHVVPRWRIKVITRFIPVKYCRPRHRHPGVPPATLIPSNPSPTATTRPTHTLYDTLHEHRVEHVPHRDLGRRHHKLHGGITVERHRPKITVQRHRAHGNKITLRRYGRHS